MSATSEFISRETLQRLLYDVKYILKNPLHSQGIYYHHNEENLLEGYALIIGPENTPYQYGFYLFKILYSNEYPNVPPKVTYLTNDGVTRFHPNLYRNGKVCLSILNTWKGDQWSSCQSISSILLTIVSVLDENPLCNEPGFSLSSIECIPYNKIITYRNFETAIRKVISKKDLHFQEMKYFKDIIYSNYKKNYNNIIELLKKYSLTENSKVYQISIYDMKKVEANYKYLLDEFIKLNPEKIKI